MPPIANHDEAGFVELHQKAAACRALASTSNTAERRSQWFARADHWEELALKRVERLLDIVKSERHDDPSRMPARVFPRRADPTNGLPSDGPAE